MRLSELCEILGLELWFSTTRDNNDRVVLSASLKLAGSMDNVEFLEPGVTRIFSSLYGKGTTESKAREDLARRIKGSQLVIGAWGSRRSIYPIPSTLTSGR